MADPEQLAEYEQLTRQARAWLNRTTPTGDHYQMVGNMRLAIDTLLADLAAANDDAARLADVLTDAYRDDPFGLEMSPTLAAHRARIGGAT